MDKVLIGRRILVVEDHYLVALQMKEMVEQHGGTVAGPAGRLEQALVLARSEPLDGAILDIDLGGDNSFPVADDLVARAVPVIFVTGYDGVDLPERFAKTPRFAKPFGGISAERAFRILASW